MKAIHPQTLSFSFLLVTSVFGVLTKLINRRMKRKFPKAIAGYTLKKKYITYDKPQMFSFAIYENSNHEKAIAKMWSGFVKDFAYFTLKNERNIYECVSRVTSPRADVHIPRFIGALESNHSLLLLTEYISGQRLDRLSNTRQSQAYDRAREYLLYLGRKLPQFAQAGIAKRGAWSLVLLYPLLLVKSLITHPRLAFLLLRGIPLYLFSVPLIFAHTKMGFTHRDLHPGNLLVKGKDIYIIDLQFCLYSLVGYDIATTLRVCWSNLHFREHLLRTLKKQYRSVKNSPLLIRGLIVHSATHGLTAGNFPKSIIDSFVDCLRFAVESDQHI